MIDFFKKLLGQEKPLPAKRPPVARPRPPSATQAAIRKPAIKTEPSVELDSNLAGRIEDGGPGKNVLVRSKYQREDTGTDDTLQIIDDNAIIEANEDGMDPYNTGKFDRSKHWDKRFRN
ncbi:MAG: hypothetical protein HKN77_03425 [Woeseiaceae bacterium]|nr:hypothetical protein [Woeseiaceae bacterium]